jgi:protein-S-isoprenylcysteine O-methyltransferase Ste14
VTSRAASAGPPDHPDLPYKPPLPFLLAIVAGIGLDNLYRLSARPPGWAPAGVTLVLLGAALLLWALHEFRSNHTSIEPWKPTTAIIESGPFAYSRNPVYIGFALVTIGVGTWVDRGMIVLLAIPAFLATDRWIVPREEVYLERKFGEAYLRYRRRVRRWI